MNRTILDLEADTSSPNQSHFTQENEFFFSDFISYKGTNQFRLFHVQIVSNGLLIDDR